MTFEEAFDNAVRAFYEGKKMTEFEKATGTPVKYNKEFFDGLEGEYKSKGKKSEKKLKEALVEEDLEDAD
jgi:hypothetical protein